MTSDPGARQGAQRRRGPGATLGGALLGAGGLRRGGWLPGTGWNSHGISWKTLWLTWMNHYIYTIFYLYLCIFHHFGNDLVFFMFFGETCWPSNLECHSESSLIGGFEHLKWRLITMASSLLYRYEVTWQKNLGGRRFGSTKWSWRIWRFVWKLGMPPFFPRGWCYEVEHPIWLYPMASGYPSSL